MEAQHTDLLLGQVMMIAAGHSPLAMYNLFDMSEAVVVALTLHEYIAEGEETTEQDLDTLSQASTVAGWGDATDMD